MESWDFARLESLVADQVEESFSLDYKAAAALHRDDRKRTEITKDVSAMANSAGGVIIYGIREPQDKAKAHFPEAIDPVARRDISKEWLEQVIQNIRPKIDGIVIHPIPCPQSAEAVVYVVEVPQSSTAHQATDFRYYRRFNFEAVPMQDYEIRDVMARRQHPIIDVVFHVLLRTQYVQTMSPGFGGREQKRHRDVAYLCASLRNSGRRVAHYITANLLIPNGVVDDRPDSKSDACDVHGLPYLRFRRKNLVQDVVGHNNVMGVSYAKYGEHRFEPVLPELSVEIACFDLNVEGFVERRDAGAKLLWESFADDAPKREGEVLIRELEKVDERKKQ